MAWQSHALATAPSQLGNANIYYPAPDALFYGPAGFGGVPYFAPIFLATGNPVLATNVMLLLSVTLSALALHCVVRLWTGLDSAGVLAATTLLVNRWYLWGFAAATPHLAPLQYFPLIVWLAATPLERLPRALLLAVLIVAQCLTDPVYVAAAVLAPLALLAGSRIVRAKWRKSGFALVGVLALSALGLAPFFAGYLVVRAQNPELNQQSLWHGWTPPSDLGSLFWRHAAPTTIAPAALALIGVAGVVALARRRRTALPHDRGWAHGALWFLGGAWISLTPISQWHEHDVYLPQIAIARTTPLYDIIRAPGRLGVAAMIGGCLLCGVAFAEIIRALERTPAVRIPARTMRVLLAAAAAWAIYAVPPAGTARIPAQYPLLDPLSVPEPFRHELARARTPLLQLPALKDGPEHWPSSNWNAYAMYLSTYHWRPILNGYSSYWPAGFIERMELAEALPNPAALAQLARETGLALIWVELQGYVPAKRVPWREAEAGRVPGLKLVARDRGALLFAVDASALDEAPP